MGDSEQMSRLLEAARAAPKIPRTIVHCDYLFRNLIIRSSNAVIIDFGTALIGDPRYDLAKLVWCDLDASQGELSSRFVRSWAAGTGVAVVPELLSL
jgi:aminoglycoside phosphotransferase (APT) family kinase protein